MALGHRRKWGVAARASARETGGALSMIACGAGETLATIGSADLDGLAESERPR